MSKSHVTLPDEKAVIDKTKSWINPILIQTAKTIINELLQSLEKDPIVLQALQDAILKSPVKVELSPAVKSKINQSNTETVFMGLSAALDFLIKIGAKLPSDFYSLIVPECDLISVTSEPNQDNLQKIPTKTNLAYVRFKNNLYFINKEEKTCIEINSPAQLVDFDKALLPTQKTKTLTIIDLKLITSLTKHNAGWCYDNTVSPAELASITQAFRSQVRYMVAVKEFNKKENRKAFLIAANKLFFYLQNIRDIYENINNMSKREIRARGDKVKLGDSSFKELLDKRNLSQKRSTLLADLPSTWLESSKIDRLLAGNLLKIKNTLKEDERAQRLCAFVETGYEILKGKGLLSVDEIFIAREGSFVLNPKINDLKLIMEKLNNNIKNLLDYVIETEAFNKSENRNGFYNDIDGLFDTNQAILVSYHQALEQAEDKLSKKKPETEVELKSTSSAPIKTKSEEKNEGANQAIGRIISQSDLKALIKALENISTEGGPEQNKIIVKLLAKFRNRDGKHTSESYVHREFMKVYLIDGYITNRKKEGLLNKVNLGTLAESLEKAATEFLEKTKNRLFVGEVKKKEKSTTKVESRQLIASSSYYSEETKQLVRLAFERAMIEGICDSKKSIYTNAQKMVIAIEDAEQTSSKYWNSLVREKVGENSGLEILVRDFDKTSKKEEADYVKKRKEDKLGAAFEKLAEAVKGKIKSQFYPRLLVYLISKERDQVPARTLAFMPAFNTVELQELKRFLLTLNGGEKTEADVYRAVLMTYICLYVNERGKDGTKTVKGPSLKYLEAILDEFAKKANSDLFFHSAKARMHDKIFGSLQEQKVSVEKIITVEFLVKNIFNLVVRSLNSRNAKSEDIFVNCFKVIERLGIDARVEWNKQVKKLLGSACSKDLLLDEGYLTRDPKTQQYRKIEENDTRAMFQNKFVALPDPWLSDAIKEYALTPHYRFSLAAPKAAESLNKAMPVASYHQRYTSS